MTASAITRLVTIQTMSLTRGAGAALKNNRGTCAVALQSCKHEAQKFLIAANDDPPLGERFDNKIRVGLRFHPQARTRRNKPHDPVVIQQRLAAAGCDRFDIVIVGSQYCGDLDHEKTIRKERYGKIAR